MSIAVLAKRVSLAVRRSQDLLQRRVPRPSIGVSLVSICSVGLVRCMCGNSVSSMGSTVEIKPKGTHTATVIFLHGLGDTGHGWASQFEEFKIPHIKYLCPNAKTMPVTLNMGMQMPSWFDIKSLSFDSGEDEDGIKSASEFLTNLVAEEEKLGIPTNRIVLAGFSQGGAVAVYTALTMEKKLAGVMGLSTWLPLHKSFPSAIKGSKDYPFFQCHGDSDPVVNYRFGEMTKNVLNTMCSNLKFKKYAGLGHSSCPQEMTDAESFLNEILPATPPSNH